MKPIFTKKDYIKANRKGSRDAELENSSGWKAIRKIHTSKRTYTRKDKYKESGKSPDFFFDIIFGYSHRYPLDNKFFRNIKCGKTLS
jgi:hypothetical protein